MPEGRKLRQGSLEGLHLVAAPRQCRNETLRRQGADGTPERRQGHVGADLHDDGRRVLGEHFDGLQEVDRLAAMPRPVVGRKSRTGCDDTAAKIGDEGQGERAHVRRSAKRGEVEEDRIETGRMEGVGDGEALGRDLVFGCLAEEPVDRGGLACDDQSLPRQAGGDGKLSAEFGERRADKVFARAQGEHRTALRQRAEELAAPGDEPDHRLGRQGACHRGGGIFTEAVAHHHIGPDAARRQSLGQGNFEGDDRRLGVFGAGEALDVRAEDDLSERQIVLFGKEAGNAVEGVAENRIGFVEAASHAEGLGPLATIGEDQTRRAVAHAFAGHGPARFALRPSGKGRRDGVHPIACDGQRQPMGMGHPPRGEARREFDGIAWRVGRDMGRERFE